MVDMGFMGELVAADGRRVLVRKLQTRDAAALEAFLAELSAESWHLFHPHARTAEEIAQRVERAVHGDDWIYVALSARKVVAYFFLWDVRKPVPTLGIGIADDWQNGKLGQQFMSILIADARRLGRDGIELTAMLDNDRAFHVYQKMGFIYQGDVESRLEDGQMGKERSLFLPLKEGAQLHP